MGRGWGGVGVQTGDPQCIFDFKLDSNFQRRLPNQEKYGRITYWGIETQVEIPKLLAEGSQRTLVRANVCTQEHAHSFTAWNPPTSIAASQHQ